jgi:hypothetical protein
MNDHTKVTNSVRQILMNELGLTKESVRNEMLDIIGMEVGRVVSSMSFDHHVERMIHHELSKLLWETKYSQSDIKSLCLAAAKKGAEDFIRNSLRFNIV